MRLAKYEGAPPYSFSSIYRPKVCLFITAIYRDRRMAIELVTLTLVLSTHTLLLPVYNTKLTGFVFASFVMSHSDVLDHVTLIC